MGVEAGLHEPYAAVTTYAALFLIFAEGSMLLWCGMGIYPYQKGLAADHQRLRTPPLCCASVDLTLTFTVDSRACMACYEVRSSGGLFGSSGGLVTAHGSHPPVTQYGLRLGLTTARKLVVTT